MNASYWVRIGTLYTRQVELPMYTGSTLYCSKQGDARWVSFHDVPETKDMGGYEVRWTRVMIKGKPIEEFSKKQLQWIALTLENDKYAGKYLSMDHSIALNDIKLYLRYQSVSSFPMLPISLSYPVKLLKEGVVTKIEKNILELFSLVQTYGAIPTHRDDNFPVATPHVEYTIAIPVPELENA